VKRHRRIKAILLLIGFIVASVHFAQAQQPKKVPRIGILFIGSRNQPHLEAFKHGLRERGYTEGKNILLEYRYAEGNNDRLPQLAAELVGGKVDVIVTTASVSAVAARRVTKTIPIVMTSGNPLEAVSPPVWPSRAETSPVLRYSRPI
jgi:putative tryptophan/tyrosine transport system substrate-binding protein